MGRWSVREKFNKYIPREGWVASVSRYLGVCLHCSLVVAFYLANWSVTAVPCFFFFFVNV